MEYGQPKWREAARAAVYAMPLEEIDPVDTEIFRNGTFEFYFERLRKEDPVHYYGKRTDGGPYWSITKYNDIMFVDTRHDLFSAENGPTYFGEAAQKLTNTPPAKMFLAMDPPMHEPQRKSVAPIVSGPNLASMEALIRERVCKVLDELPRGETFDWVERVSKELTSLMLTTLFNTPMEDRHMLCDWSDVATSSEIDVFEQQKIIDQIAAYFGNLFVQRMNAPPADDLMSMLAHSPSTKNMTPEELIGNSILLLVGGNDTTRNSMTGGLLALHQNPAEYDKLMANPDLIPNMVSEIIRWQTPLAYMRRLAKEDVEVGGKLIRKGEVLLMWYVSGNRDDEVIDRANEFLIDRPRARQHLAFGFGIHRCVGNRLAELQLRILWEEILKRFPKIEVVGEPVRVSSSFANGYEELPVRIPL